MFGTSGVEGLRGEGVVMVGNVDDVGPVTVVISGIGEEEGVVVGTVGIAVVELEEKVVGDVVVVVGDVVVVVGSCVRISISVSGLSLSTFRHQIV